MLCHNRSFVQELVRVGRLVLDTVLLVIGEERSWQRILVVATDHLKLADDRGLESCGLTWKQVAQGHCHGLILGALLGYHCRFTSSDSVLVLLLRFFLLFDLRLNSAIVDARLQLRQK